jgi:phenylacetate-CoA ligase
MEITMNRTLSRQLYYVFHNLIKRDQKVTHYNTLVQTQWFSKKKMHEFQLEKFRKLLVHAGTFSPYYREAFRKAFFDPTKIQSLSAISKIPILTKSKLRRHFSDIACTEPKNQDVLPNSTSGSTGEKTIFYSDRRAEQIKAPIVRRNFEWLGIKLGDRELRLWGAALSR